MAASGMTCVLKQSGVSTAFTTEACSNVSGNIYQIDDTTKRVWDPDTAITVYDNGSPVADTAVTIDYLFGKITFDSPPTTPVTVSGNYLPMWALGEVRSFDLSMAADLGDVTAMTSSTANRSKLSLLKDFSGSLTMLSQPTDDIDTGGSTVKPYTDFEAGSLRLVEVTFPSGQIFRGFIKYSEVSESAAFDGVVEVTLNFQGCAVRGTDQTEGSSFGFSS